MTEVVVEDSSPAVIANVRGLLARVFPKASHLDDAYLRWDYAENPDGPALLVNARRGDAVVAHWAGQALRARVAGEEARGVLVHHLCTHPDHRGRGLFRALARRAEEAARERGLRFIVAVANANSTPGFLGSLGFQHVGALDARLGPGAPPPSRAPEPVFERRWSEETLAWRLACPGRRYRRVDDPHGGAGVVAATGIPGIRAWLGEAGGAAVQALPAAPRRARLTLWLGREPGVRWSRSGFVAIPMRLRPSPLNLVYRDLGTPGVSLELDAVRFRGLDFDAY